jgi:hypothetical protein
MIKAAFCCTLKGDKGGVIKFFLRADRIYIQYCPEVSLARYFNPQLMAKKF